MRDAVFFFELAREACRGVAWVEGPPTRVSRRLGGAAGPEAGEEAWEDGEEVAHCAEEALEDGVGEVEGEEEDGEGEGHGLGDLTFWCWDDPRCIFEVVVISSRSWRDSVHECLCSS